jgi:hypothetical protein
MVLMMMLMIDVTDYHDAGGMEVEEPQKKSMMSMI